MTDATFVGRRVAHEAVQVHTAPAREIFPLLCPVREAEWVPGWKHRMVYSASGLAEPGCVFATPNDDGTESIWLCTEHDRERQRVCYVWVWPGMIATRLEFALAAAGEGCRMTVRYEYTALSDAGDREAQGYDRGWFDQKVRRLEAALKHFLREGTCLGTQAAVE